MKKLKVALIQYDRKNPDVSENTETGLKLVREAKEGGADLVLFPECFLTSYSCPKAMEKLPPLQELEQDPEFQDWCERALTEESEPIIKFRKLAAELAVGIVITSFTKGVKRPQNSAYLIDREGRIALKYSKVHTCDFDWEQYLESGDRFSVCEFDGIRIGIMICYDREYPESARELALQGAELILVPNDCGDMPPRLMELAVRAMENMVGMAMANPPGERAGCSCAYSPIVWDADGSVTDNTIHVAGEREEGIVYVDFDLDQIREHREREDLGKYRKPGAYRHLVSEDTGRNV